MNVSYLTTPGGEELAILPRSELEELMASSDHAKALAAYRSGHDPGLNSDEIRELLTMSPLAFWRRKRGLTQAALASQTQLTQNYISDLETARREGSPAQWLRIARVLGLTIEELVAES